MLLAILLITAGQAKGRKKARLGLGCDIAKHCVRIRAVPFGKLRAGSTGLSYLRHSFPALPCRAFPFRRCAAVSM